AERLRHVHLLGLRRRHHEVSGRRRARHVLVRVHPLPQQRRERLHPLIPQVLVLVPRPVPPPVRPPGLLLARVLRDRSGHREGRVHRLEPRRQRIHQRHVVAPVLVHHRQLHPHPRPRLDLPRPVRLPRHVLRIIGPLVLPLDDEAVIGRRKRKARRRVRHSHPVVQPPRPVLLDRQVLLVVRRHVLHRDRDREVVRRPPLERVLPG